MGKVLLLHGRSEVKLGELGDSSVDSIVTDPPYGLSFMGKKWDYDVPGVDIWRECLRVLKPGGHLLSFGGSRTYHRMVVNIEDAGFEIRDQIMWVYGCLSDDTEILTKKGWEQYRIFTKNSTFVEEEILIYDTETDIYKWENPPRWNEYTVNEDTAYRIQSDNTDQIVSRGHRCLVEREGKLVFVQADELNGVECVPTLPSDFSFIPQGHEQILQSSMQRTDKGRGMGVSWVEGEFIGNTGKEKSIGFKGRKESCVEGGSYLLQTEGEICEPINQVCEVSGRICSNGEERRVCNGTQVDCCVADREGTNEVGVCSSLESQRRGQQIGEFNAFQFQCGTQAVGTRTTYKTSLATVTPIRYSGVIFCPTVSTSSFVARRNGKVFITGNSGFPKSLNIGKAVDKLNGNERELIRTRTDGNKGGGANTYDDDNYVWDKPFEETKGNSEFEGWGTALKPAHEPIVLARKPISEKNIAENCLKWGTGGLNIDGCRVGVEERHSRENNISWGISRIGEDNNIRGNRATGITNLGRFPANLIHDGSDEVVGLFPEQKSGNRSSQYKIGNTEGEMFNHGIYGKYAAKKYDDIPASSGSAARFFFAAKFDNDEYFNYLCTVNKYILSCQDQKESQSNVNTAGLNLYLKRQVEGFVLKLVAIEENQEEQALRNTIAPFMNEIRKLLNKRCENDIETILSSGQKCLQELRLTIMGKWNEIHVNYVEIQKLTNTMMIIQNLLNIDGFVDAVISNTMLCNMVLGEEVSAFKYCAKASKADRDERLEAMEDKVKLTQMRSANGTGEKNFEGGFTDSIRKNTHATVKPTSLMRYLCKLITPKGGTVLDPFMGSGSTGKAAVMEGFGFIGVEMEAEYVEISRARIAFAEGLVEEEVKKVDAQLKLF